MWNPAIADITLLALGTCAPQISLAVIDAVRRLGKTGGQGERGSRSYDLGAGTIIGGAAFNIFPILAVCVLVPPAGTVKRISDVGLFLVEFLWSLWAYVWLYIVLQVWTPGEVTIAEAVMTVLQLPLLMLHAYAQEQRWPFIALPLSPPTSQPPTASSEAVAATAGAASSAMQEGVESATVRSASFTDNGMADRVVAGSGAAVSGLHGDLSPGVASGPAMEGHAALGDFSTPSRSRRRRRSSEHDRSSRRSSGGGGGEGGMGRGSRRQSLSSQAEDREWDDAEEDEEVGRGRRSSGQAFQQGDVEVLPQPDSHAQLIASRHSHGSDGSSGGTKGVSFGMRWRQQIVLSMMLHPSDYNDLTAQGSMHPSHEQPAARKAQPVAARVRRVVVQAVCFLWKALCAVLIPPPDALHGYPAFITSILVITLIAALVVELASLFGCVTGVNSFVVSITLLATGTSIPDLIASVVAADHLPTADSAIANINARRRFALNSSQLSAFRSLQHFDNAARCFRGVLQQHACISVRFVSAASLLLFRMPLHSFVLCSSSPLLQEVSPPPTPLECATAAVHPSPCAARVLLACMRVLRTPPPLPRTPFSSHILPPLRLSCLPIPQPRAWRQGTCLRRASRGGAQGELLWGRAWEAAAGRLGSPSATSAQRPTDEYHSASPSRSFRMPHSTPKPPILLRALLASTNGRRFAWRTLVKGTWGAEAAAEVQRGASGSRGVWGGAQLLHCTHQYLNSTQLSLGVAPQPHSGVVVESGWKWWWRVVGSGGGEWLEVVVESGWNWWWRVVVSGGGEWWGVVGSGGEWWWRVVGNGDGAAVGG
ncbi:unnamed protein product [Closterium sp. Naga37s-1]|nr:unnamed protein product [Closterium sp. Naga37s-1]